MPVIAAEVGPFGLWTPALARVYLEGMETVPATRRIRYSRVRNIDTDRLERRLAYLRENLPALAYACDGRKSLRDMAREILAIERELALRTEWF